MGTQVLGAVKTRRAARVTGLDIIRVTTWAHPVVAFVTRDHRHGRLDWRAGTFTVREPDTGPCMWSCAFLDPGEPSGYSDGLGVL